MFCFLSLIYKSASSFDDIYYLRNGILQNTKTEKIIFIVYVQYP